MNSIEARLELRRPLLFGNLRQIAAIRYLDALDAARLRLMRCESCAGVGVVMERGETQGRLCFCLSAESDAVLKELGVHAKIHTGGRGETASCASGLRFT